MAPPLRKLLLTTHVTVSVGWLGAVVVVVGHAAPVLTGDEGVVRAAYLAMDLVGWSVLVPLSLAALGTGVVQSLATSWGLFRHWWVVLKLALTLVATGVLLLYTRTLGALADRALDESVEPLRTASPLVHATGALVVLLGTVVLSVYKPRGLTRYGWRMQVAGR